MQAFLVPDIFGNFSDGDLRLKQRCQRKELKNFELNPEQSGKPT
jgi:hypothetical protein